MNQKSLIYHNYDSLEEGKALQAKLMRRFASSIEKAVIEEHLNLLTIYTKEISESTFKTILSEIDAPYKLAWQYNPQEATSTTKGKQSVQKGEEAGCFIATACYSSPHCKEVIELRRFRDEKLLPSRFGALAVELYYHFSPPLAHSFQYRPKLRIFVRNHFVRPIVQMIQRKRRKKVKSTQAVRECK